MNDYGNQAHWEQFDRHAVLPWLEALTTSTRTTEGIAPEGAVPWTAPSDSGLSERLRGSRDVEVFVPRIAGGEDHGRQLDTVRFVRNQLEASPERTIRVYTEHAVRDSVLEASGKELAALTLLAEITRAGRLEFLHSGPVDRRSGFPRLATDAEANGQCFYSADWNRPLLDGLLPSDSAFVEGTISHTTRARIECVRRDARRESDAFDQFFLDTKRFDYRAGQARDLAEVFAPLRNVGKASITIRDPYLFSQEHNLESATELLDCLNSLCGGLASATLIWKRDVAPGDAIQRFRKKLEGRHLDSVRIKYASRRTSEGGHFHDRRLIADVMRGGERKRYRWDLTSGVDNLMDPSREASVFLSEMAQI